MPRSADSFFNDIVENYKNEYTVIDIFTPFNNPIIGRRCYEDNPIGEYRHLEVDKKVDNIIKEKLKEFDNDRETICVMARSRDRFGDVDGETWNPLNWELFINMLIGKLNLNVVMMGIPKKGNYPGSLSFENKKYLKSLVFNDKNSVDYQISLLKNTKCSIYGASGAVTLAFFTNTPVFTQQSKENADRLNFKWQKKLTNNHKNVKIFDKYSMGNLYDSPVEELFNEFKTFYEGI